MRPTGFSTGALAFADFRRGLELVRQHQLPVIELSALRTHELAPLLAALDSLDLKGFRHISLHIPSSFSPEEEQEVLRLLNAERHRGWLFVAHPDTLHTPHLWRDFGPQLCIENMDQRKPVGRTLPEMVRVFEQFPEASWCFDIGHARQVDPTMIEACRLVDAFRDKLRQVHVSEVNSRSKHDPLSRLAIAAFRQIAPHIPDDIPLILESVIAETEIAAELRRVRAALPATGETPEPHMAAGEWVLA